MHAESIIRQADQAGIELFLAGDRIAARPKSKLSADLRELIKTHRQEVVRYLSAKSPQSKLIRLAIQSGIFDQGIQLEEKEIAALVPPSDWRGRASFVMAKLNLEKLLVMEDGIYTHGVIRESYCVDMHSRSGFSGSPVFVYRTPGGDFSEKGVINLSRFMMFLGIHWGQFPEK